MEAMCGEKCTHDEMMNEKPFDRVNERALQTCRGKKRPHDKVDDERPFYIESVKQVTRKSLEPKLRVIVPSLPMCLPTLKLR